MVITREADYALRLMLVLAEHRSGRPVSSRALADESRVPYEIARSILARLTDAGLLDSYRGRTGGYHLARGTSEIKVGEILAVAGEHLDLNACVVDETSCSSSDSCAMHPIWISASELLRGYLGEMTLQEVVDSSLPQSAAPAC